MLRGELRPLGDVQAERARAGRRAAARRSAHPGPGAQDDRQRLRVDARVPFGRRCRVARRAVGAAHHHEAREQPRQLGLAEDRDRDVRQRAQRDERDLAGPAAGLRDDEVGRRAASTGPPGRRQLRVADAVRAVRLRRRRERPRERLLAPQRDLDVGAARQLEHGPRVLRDLRAIDVAARQVTATSSASGEAQAYRSARLSSIPVSQSTRMGMRSATGRCYCGAPARDRRVVDARVPDPAEACRLRVGGDTSCRRAGPGHSQTR